MSAARPERGVTRPQGFRAGSAGCGIRVKAPDLALVASDREASAACVYTRNQVQAAPLVACREALAISSGRACAIVLNSGNANACTGEAGLDAARATAAEAGRLLGVDASRVLVASTGVIGQRLPVEKLLAGLPAAVSSLSIDGHDGAAKAIMTTDLVQKEAGRVVALPGGTAQIGAMAKGSGMIHPDMATTLAVVTTDAAISPGLLHAMLVGATQRTFNRISVDGDTSTNDMIAILANGASGVAVGDDPSTQAFTEALHDVLLELALMIARDGEGATRLVSVTVAGARSEEDALQVSRTIASSPLVKTAIAGGDANWGRIVAAVGRAGVPIDPALLSVRLGAVTVLEPGCLSRHDEAAATAEVKKDPVSIVVDLGLGGAEATTWTCDLTHGYIDINGSYRS